MPGRPRRGFPFERIIDRNPALALTLGKGKLPELTVEENLLLYKSIITGLLKRISLLSPQKPGHCLKASLASGSNSRPVLCSTVLPRLPKTL
ncbi:MAG: hypothetical protein ABI988_01910 [Nitrospirota bacterium]